MSGLADLRHRNNVEVCPRCEEKLAGADPRIATWFRDIKKLFPTVHVAVSYRGPIEQNKAFEEGKSKLRYPKSKHNATKDKKPAARALDLFNLSTEGIATFPMPFYKKIADACAERKDPIRWGGTFKTLGDGNHFEMA